MSSTLPAYAHMDFVSFPLASSHLSHLSLLQKLAMRLYNKFILPALAATAEASRAGTKKNILLLMQADDNISFLLDNNNGQNSTLGDAGRSFSSANSASTSTTLFLSTGSDIISTTLRTTTATRVTAIPTAVDEPSVNSYFVAMPWPKAIVVSIFLVLIMVTVMGNTLVILAVLTTRRLRTVTNCFVMNLAITDWLVGTCVMPPSVILYITGKWRFGWILCDIWISLDILLCTGSILSLCAISLDRYLAVTQPLTYSKKRRSKRLALFMILVVWITALSITCPPYLGWYEPGLRQQHNIICRYNQNRGYVVFSAMGSFFIPLTVMVYVYVKIGFVLTSRRQRIARDANSERTADHDINGEHFMSESDNFHCNPHQCFPSGKSRWSFGNTTAGLKNGTSSSLKCSKLPQRKLSNKCLTLQREPTFYELVEISRMSSVLECSCKYGATCMHKTIAVSEDALIAERKASYDGSQTVFSETCLGGTASKLAEPCTAVTVTAVQHQQQQQQQHQPSQPNFHSLHQRIPMRVSTTKRDTKTAKTLTIVMGGLIACWLPFFVYYLLIPFLPPPAVIEDLMAFFTWVGWVNCAINPFIYAFYNPDFRTAFWRLTCRHCKQKPPPNHLAMFRG